MLTPFITILASVALAAPAPKQSDIQRVKQLKAYIEKERPAFEKRKVAQRNILEELDRINSDQNEARKKLQISSRNYQELAMASDNLAVEYEKQKKAGVLPEAQSVGTAESRSQDKARRHRAVSVSRGFLGFFRKGASAAQNAALTFHGRQEI